MSFKSKFRVKDKTKELCFFDYFYRRFSQKNVRVWEKNVLLMKMNTDCLGGGELEAVLRHTQSKIVDKQGAIRILQDSFNNVVNFNAEMGRRQDATLRDPHLLLVQLGKSGTHSNPERTFRQEALNKLGEVAPETEIPEVRQNAVLPRCVVNFLKVKVFFFFFSFFFSVVVFLIF